MDNKPFVLSEQRSIASHFLSQLRDAVVQQDRMRFRRNMERLGELLGYELSKALTYTPKTVRTPLGDSPAFALVDELVLSTILRAGIPFHHGFLNVFDQADSGFIGACRNESTSAITVNIDYVSIP